MQTKVKILIPMISKTAKVVTAIFDTEGELVYQFQKSVSKLTVRNILSKLQDVRKEYDKQTDTAVYYVTEN